MNRLTALFSIGLIAACNRGENPDAIALDWNEGETFHVAAQYKTAEVKHEESAAGLEDSRDTQFGETWSDEVVWSYQVVETGLLPEQSDQLYDYSIRFDGEQVALTVIRAYIDDTLNDDPAIIEADPVVYMVFREDRDRMAGLVSFVNVDGTREETAYSSKELSKSWSALSQSQLTHAPTFLAPFGATWDDKTTTLEDGSLLDTVSVDAGITDVVFDDKMTDGVVIARYEDGQPWPTYTDSDNMVATLLTGAEVDAKRGERAYMQPDVPEDFDYRAALAASIDIDASLRLSEEEMAGGWEAAVYDEFKPWAGSWWKLSEAALVFGYESYNDTYSRRIKDDVDPIKKEMDALSDAIRNTEDEAVKTEKREEYQKKQSELVTILVDFYKGIYQDLDGGRITLTDGKMTHTEDDWSYDLDKLSPMDKFAVKLYSEGETYNNPFYLPAWEILNSYNPAGGSWWGHCNGWAAAAILTNEPRESIYMDVAGNNVEFTTADVKGLLTEAHYSTYSRFYGARYYKEGDDIADLYPSAFHKIISFYLKDQRVPLVFDTTAGDAVWNYPAWAADVDIVETTPADPNAGKININTATMDELDTLPGIGPSKANAIVNHREYYGPFQSVESITDVYGVGNGTLDDIRDLVTVDVDDGARTFEVTSTVTFTTDGVDETWVDGEGATPKGFDKVYSYTLKTDATGLVLEGTWEDENEHPDFAWVPYSNPNSAGNGSSENAFLPYGTLIDYIGEDFERH